MSYLKNLLKEQTEKLCIKLEKNILSNKSLKCKVVFGPINSRRLGYVLGINNIKPDICSYNCIYCPSANKSCCSICTNTCLSPYELHSFMKNKLSEVGKLNQKINYLVFTGSGEPALDTGLSKEIMILREFGYKIAVFTNASLIWNKQIQENLLFADYVSIKIDTVNPETWLKINRPHKRLKYNLILDGIKQFSKTFKGKLSTETMLIRNVNDNYDEIENLSAYLNTINSEVAYFTTPIYPPDKSYAICPDTENLEYLKTLIREKISKSILLCCPDDEFTATDDFENELLGMLSIHPIGSEVVKQFTKNAKDIKKLKEMVELNIVREIVFQGKNYYVENIAS